MSQSVRILVIAGASGSGKSTLVKYLMDTFPDVFCLSISYTTREPRENEVSGREYYFISKEEFQLKIQNNEFLEYAEYAGNLYGTDVDVVKQVPSKKVLILEIEKKGVENIKKQKIPAKYLYIYAPLPSLYKRILKRAMISEDELSKRLMKADEENRYGCSPEFDYVITNTSLEDTLKEACSVLSSWFLNVHEQTK
ncbi:guanylate kinase [Nematocida sp. AWRm77]|nr:guanylate kinase [Nematocida sp. AWRm77]